MYQSARPAGGNKTVSSKPGTPSEYRSTLLEISHNPHRNASRRGISHDTNEAQSQRKRTRKNQAAKQKRNTKNQARHPSCSGIGHSRLGLLLLGRSLGGRLLGRGRGGLLGHAARLGLARRRLLLGGGGSSLLGRGGLGGGLLGCRGLRGRLLRGGLLYPITRLLLVLELGA